MVFLVPKRKQITKKQRFDIFKRDSFTCQYCGSKPPSVVLEVDHVIPVASGGDNQEENLLTSCFDCNRGKGARLLSDAPDAVANKIAIKNEKAAQLKAFEKLLKQQKELLNKKIAVVEHAFASETECSFTPKFSRSVGFFFEKLPEPIVLDCMDIALNEHNDPEIILKYFCGCCWNRIREAE